MPRGNQLILVLILLIIIGGAGTWLYYSRQQKEYIPAAIGLPRSALVVYQGHTPQKDMQSLLQNSFFKEFAANPGVASFAGDFQFLDSMLAKEEILREMIAGQPLLVSVHATAAQRFQLLFLLQTENLADAGDIKDWAEEKWPGLRVFERNVEGKKIYDIKGGANELYFSYAFVDNILALSRSTVLVEDAIAAAGSNSIKSSPLLTEIVRHTGESRLYLNFRTLPDLFTAFSDPATAAKAEGLKNLFDFGAYSWRFTEEDLKLTGSVYLQKGDAFSAFLNQNPQQLRLAEVVPSSCALLTQHGVNSFGGYFQSLMKVRDKNYEAEIQKLADAKAVSLQNDILPALGSQWGYALLDPGEPGIPAETYLVAGLADTGAAWEAWNKMNEKAAPAGDAEFKGHAYRGHSTQRFSIPEILPWLYGAYGEDGFTHYCRINTFLLFARNASALERAIDAFLDDQTLAGTSAYKEFSSQTGSGLNFSLFISPVRSQALTQQYLGYNAKERFLQNLPVYLKAGSLGLTLASSGNYLYSQVILTKAEAGASGAEVAWSLNLEADAATKPYIVQNPDTRQKEILIQDKNQNLYLISASGKIIWKKDIEELIVGEVYQVDLYRNNDLQYLFATANRVYLLNRQGDPAGNYPIRLGAPTASGVALFDFANSKEYSYYVGTEKGRIYGFNGNGRPLTGWSPLTLDATISVPIKYFSMQKKDYLFAVTEKGSLYIWNKDGKRVQKSIELGTRFRNPFRMQFGASPAQTFLFSADTAGVLYTVYLNGKIQKQAYTGFRNPFFDYFDGDGNGKAEFVLSSDSTISAFETGTKAIWSIAAREKLSYPPQPVSTGNQTYIVYTAPNANQLHVVSRNGAAYPNFPANGNAHVTVTDINADGMPELIAPARGQLLYMYRLTR